MRYVIGIDLGTSAVKVLLVNKEGEVEHAVAKNYPLIQEHPGYNEQNPEEWVDKTLQALRQLVTESGVNPAEIAGLSYSGQMHGLVLLDERQQLIRPAILWNDTRTTEQCEEIKTVLGDRLLTITKNQALEGFTLPKILWVKEHEPVSFKRSTVFLLPKDYLRFRMTGRLHSEYSDAAGTLLLDVVNKKWSSEICQAFDLPVTLCPSLVDSGAYIGTLLPEIARITGLSSSTKVFAGGADNACGAIGAGILSAGRALCSIGTSGVFLSFEENKQRNFAGKVHFFNHGQEDSYYTMGVTLAAGYSLSWFKNTFAENDSFDQLLDQAAKVPIGSNGLLFAPYLVGERTPYVDAKIRGTFTGIDGSHKKEHFVRAVMEGIVFSINDTVDIFKANGKNVDTIISIGGGAKNDLWLQMQADIFNGTVISLANEQGPGMGAAMLAASSLKWFSSLKECAEHFIRFQKKFKPIQENVEKYKTLYQIYKKVYTQTKDINYQLFPFREQ